MMWFQIVLMIIELLLKSGLFDRRDHAVGWLRKRIGKDTKGLTRKKLRDLFDEYKKEHGL